MEIYNSQEVQLLEIKGIYNSAIGIIYNSSIKTVGQIIDILKTKIAYSVEGLGLSFDDFYSKLYLSDKQTHAKLSLDSKLESTSGKLFMGLERSECILDSSLLQELKEKQFPKYFNTPNSIQIQVKTLAGKTIVVNLNPETPIELLKYKLYDVDGLAPDQARLIYSGTQLDNTYTLQDYKIKEGQTIHIVARLRGGMFHEVSGRNGYSKLSGLIVYDATTDKFIDC